MDKDTVLTGVLQRDMMSTLVGGEQPVVTSNKYIPLLDEAVHAVLAGQTRTVVLLGPEGCGKTTALEKLVVGWAKGQRLHGFCYVFLVRLRELNPLDGMSLETLMLRHHAPAGSVPLLLQRPEQVLFLFDDLDRSPEPSVPSLCSDPGQAASLPCLVASLLQGSLLKGAAFVVTSRSSARVDFLTATRLKVLGFLKPQREAYCRGFFTDPAAASRAWAHMERTLGFYDFCTSPRFCWTVCSVYKSLMDAGAELPETLTQLFTGVLVQLVQTLELDEACREELVSTLGRVASHCALDQRSSCTKEEMDSFGFQRFQSSAGVFFQVDRSDRHVFSFHSRLMQDFLLAVSFYLDKSTSESVDSMLEKHKGHAEFLDLFLCGLSEPLQRRPLEVLLGPLHSGHILDFRKWLKSSCQAALKGFYKDEHHRCFHLLHQAQSESLVKEVVTPAARIGISYGGLSLRDCAALSFVVTRLGHTDLLNLYGTRDLTEEQAQTLLPAMSVSQKISLSDSSLSIGAVPHLSSALSGGLTKELDLSYSRLGDEKFRVLCAGLRGCKLRQLKLAVCSLTKATCGDLESVLTSGSSQLCLLDMRSNHIGDQGFIKLCTALRSPLCKLQELQLQSCELTAASMEALSAALCSGPSEMRRVNLTQNSVGVRGVEALSKALQHPLCNLQSLNLFDCELTGECCPLLAEALMSEHCSLSELDLSVNDLGQSGALLLCRALRRPGCPIEKLSLKRCQLTRLVFEELSSVLTGGSQLKALVVGLNAAGDQGAKHLWDAVAHPGCLLEELDVEMSGLTDACVDALCSAIRASKTLKSLELRNNALTDASVPSLVQVMQDSVNMQEMNLKYNDFSEEAFDLLNECEKIRY